MEERVKSARGPKDMAISLVVLLVPVLLLVLGYQWLSGTDAPTPVDQSAAITSARSAGFQVGEPAGLREGWVPVSAVFREEPEGMTLRLGYVTPEGQGVQLVQSTVPADQLLAEELGEGAQPGGAAAVDGHAWQLYGGLRQGEQALVRLEPDRTTVVVGPATVAELRELGASVDAS